MQATKRKSLAETQWFDIQKAWFIPYESLGVLEHLLDDAFGSNGKRERAAACRNITRVLTGLKLIPAAGNVTGLAFGCTTAGQRGLFIMQTVGTQLRGADMPSEPAYAAERKEATS